jgi:hypothetical protein
MFDNIPTTKKISILEHVFGAYFALDENNAYYA